jgi:hypothetical protein
MVIENSGNINSPQPGSNPLREALSGEQVRADRQPPEVQNDTAPSIARDIASFAQRYEATVRQINDRFQQVQERMVADEITRDALGNIQNELRGLRESIGRLGDEPVNLEQLGQTLNNIDNLAMGARFNNEPLVQDMTAEGLGLTRITPPRETGLNEIGQALDTANTRVEDRLEETRQEQEVNRREMQRLEVGLENINAARDAQRLNEARDVQNMVDAVREDIQRGGGEMNLRPSRVMELI